MSHTDTTDPWWVRGYHAAPTRRREFHALHCEDDPDPRAHKYNNRSQPCTLDDPSQHGNHRVPVCEYWSEDHHRYRHTGRPGRDIIALYYWAPERAATRNALRDAVKTYNGLLAAPHSAADHLDDAGADGHAGNFDSSPYEYLYDIDPDIPAQQHRNAPYSGGYWD